MVLVGPSNSGKTETIRFLASILGPRVDVFSMNSDIDSMDILGGYEQVDLTRKISYITEELTNIVREIISMNMKLSPNATAIMEGLNLLKYLLNNIVTPEKFQDFRNRFNRFFSHLEGHPLLKTMSMNIEKMTEIITKEASVKFEWFDGMLVKAVEKGHWLILDNANLCSPSVLDRLNSLLEIDGSLLINECSQEMCIRDRSSSIENSFVFNFVEGSLVKTIRAGEWLLLDEVNLATADTLESISDLLTEPDSRSILLSEKGDAEPIKAHPDFRIFACMNPATDVGKRDLPMGIRSRFTEIYVHSPERDITDLLSIIDKYIGKYSVSDEWVGNDIAELYLEAKKLSDNNTIVDGSNQKPHFSIRTLTRTLLYVTDIIHIYGLRRSLYDGFCMSFLTLLDQKSEAILKPVIEKFTLGRLKNVKSIMSQTPPSPGPDYVQFKHYWMKKGPNTIQEQAHYIICLLYTSRCV